MRCQRVLLTLLPILSWVLPLFTQNHSAQQAIELILLQIDGDEEQAAVEERLTYWASYPLDINTATIEELSDLPLLDDFFLRNLLVERSRRGSFHSTYELKEVQGASTELLALLEPFITARPPTATLKRPLQQSLHLGFGTELTRYERPYRRTPRWALRYEADKETAHQGSRQNWNFYFIAEKDQGEPWLPLRQGLFDYLSSALSYQNQTGLQIVVGDYRITHGIGLLMGQSYFYLSTLSSEMAPPSKANRTIRPHRSFREYHFLRGAAVELPLFQALSLTAYAGYEKLDARVVGNHLRTLYEGGMHRTEEERTPRHQAQREVAGGSIAWDTPSLHLALNGLLYRHRALGKQRQLLYPPHQYPQTTLLKATSLDFHYLARSWKVYGEWLINRKERMALQGGLTFWSESWGQFSLVGRYLGTAQVTPYGIADSYFSTNRNEKGVQFAWQGELAYNWRGGLYLDHFYKLQPEAGIGTGGNLHLIAEGAYFSYRTQFQVRARYLKIQNRADRWSLRLALQHNITDAWRLRLRGNLAQQVGAPIGWGLSTRLQYHHPHSHRWRGEVGLQYFHLDQTSMVVQSDNPFLPYHYHQPQLRGNGWRATFALRFQPNRQLGIDLRTGHTLYTVTPNTPLPSLLEITLHYHL